MRVVLAEGYFAHADRRENIITGFRLNELSEIQVSHLCLCQGITNQVGGDDLFVDGITSIYPDMKIQYLKHGDENFSNPLFEAYFQ